MTKERVLVLGGGLSGLTVAHLLQKKGFVPVILEGGKQKKISPSPTLHPLKLHAKINLKKWDHVLNLGGRTVLWGGWVDPQYSSAKVNRFLNVKKLKIPKWLQKKQFQGKLEADKSLCRKLSKGISIKTNRLVTKLEIAQGKIQGVWCGKKFFAGTKVVVCLSPVETVRLLFNSGYQSRSLGKGFINHGLLGFVVLLKKEKCKEYSAFRRKSWGIVEFRGFFSGKLIDESLSDYRYARIHSIIEIPASRNKYLYKDKKNKSKLSLKYDLTIKDKRIFSKARAETLALIESLFPEHEGIINLHQDSEFAIAHEVGGCNQVIHQDGRVKNLKGLWIADASILNRTYPSYPTAPLLQEIFKICEQVH